MSLRFSDHPGAFERHLMRKLDNPLFPDAKVDQAAVDAAHAWDAENDHRFLLEFRSLVEEAVAFRPTEESETVLRLKGRLEEAYARCAALGQRHDQIAQAVERLLEVVVGAIRSGAGDDAQALTELEQEEAVRLQHRELLRHPLVADLMLADSPIYPDELAATLLSEAPAAFEAALWLFSPEQLTALRDEGRQLLERLRGEGRELPEAWARLAQMDAAIREEQP